MPTLEEIRKIDQDSKDEALRIRLCLEHNMCPVCGEQLVRPLKEVSMMRRNFFGLRKKEEKIMTSANIRCCSVDQSHYSEQEYYEDDEEYAP